MKPRRIHDVPRDARKLAADDALRILQAVGMSKPDATERAPFLAAILAHAYKRCPKCSRWFPRTRQPSGRCPSRCPECSTRWKVTR